MRGRKPKPTALKLIAGNPGHRPMNANEPIFDTPDTVPSAPGYLSDRAAAHWENMARQLHPIGLLTVADFDALARYCEAFARWVDAQEQLQKHGLLVKAQNGFPVQSPYIAISNKCVDIMNKIGAEFGLTPSSRSRIAVPKKKAESPYSKFINKA